MLTTDRDVLKKELISKLEGFIGTECYYKVGLGRLKMTDGVKYLCDKSKCYWLVDLVASYQPKLRNYPFQVWNIKVDEKQKAIVTCREDIGQPEIVKQKISYTDFLLDDFEFYCIDDVILLKSEY